MSERPLVARYFQEQSDPLDHALQAALETAAFSRLANSESRRSDRIDPAVDRVAVELQNPAVDMRAAVGE